MGLFFSSKNGPIFILSGIIKSGFTCAACMKIKLTTYAINLWLINENHYDGSKRPKKDPSLFKFSFKVSCLSQF